MNRFPVVFNSNIPYYQPSMIAYASHFPYPTTFETRISSSNPLESSDSLNSDFRFEINKCNAIEMNNSGSKNKLLEGKPIQSELVASTNIRGSVQSERNIALQSNSSQLQNEISQSNNTKSTSSESNSKQFQHKNQKISKSVKHKPNNLSAQDFNRAISLFNSHGLRNLSLKGIYYDRRNHGWQVRIRKRQTEISRYFSAKRYGVEKSYEMALRFYQVNIIGNLQNDIRTVRGSESQSFDNSAGIDNIDPSNSGFLQKDQSNSQELTSKSENNTHNSSLDNTSKTNLSDSISNKGFQNVPNDIEYNQLISHYITTCILNNILVNQIVANNIFANAMINSRNASNLQNNIVPIHNFSKISNIQTHGASVTNCVNSPCIPSTPVINPSVSTNTFNESQKLLRDIIVNAISDSENVWKGLSFDNRNYGWNVNFEGAPEKFFSTKEHGDIDSLVLALQYKLTLSKFECETSSLRDIVSNNVVELQKIMSIYDNCDAAEDKDLVNEGNSGDTTKSFKDIPIQERLDHFSLSELTGFISISQQIKQMISGLLLRSTQTALSSIYFNAVPLDSRTSLLNQNCNAQQSFITPNLTENPYFPRNNSSLVYNQVLQKNQNQFGVL